MKQVNRPKLTIFIFATALLVISTLIPRPFTRKFQCVTNGPGNTTHEQYIMRRSEHGLPLPIIKRSTSDFDCKPLDGKGFGGEKRSTVNTILLTNPDHAHEQYAYGYIVISSIFIDAAFWLLIAFTIRAARTLKSK
jgi:hypothetical protein